MRGPNSDGDAHVAEAAANLETSIQVGNSGKISISPQKSENETPPSGSLRKMGRLLMDSFSMGKMRRCKVFGVPISDLPLNCQGIPNVAHRLCCYLELYGLNERNLFGIDKNSSKMTERCRISFDRAGDADLESCHDAKGAASSLILWLEDLPQPLVPDFIAARLVAAILKYDVKEITDVNAEMRTIMESCPDTNLRVLYMVVRLLFLYANRWFPDTFINALPDIFANVLMRDNSEHHAQVLTALIFNFRKIFDEQLINKAFKIFLKPAEFNADDKCPALSPPLNQKLARSNSEEELNPEDSGGFNESNKICKAIKQNGMRRVNSHENFSRDFCPSLVRVERNSECRANSRDENNNVDRLVTNRAENAMDVRVAPPPFNSLDGDLEEEKRKSERFVLYATPKTDRKRSKMPICRNYASFKGDFEKENEGGGGVQKWNLESLISDTEGILAMDNLSFSPTSSTDSSRANTPRQSPVPSEYPYRVTEDFSEPLTSHRRFRYDGGNTKNMNEELSAFSKDVTSPMLRIFKKNFEYPSDSSIAQINKNERVNKQMKWIRKKMKKFEEGYDGDFKRFPTMSEKISRSQSRKWTSRRDEYLYLKPEDFDNFTGSASEACKEEFVKHVMEKLRENRCENDRPEIDGMNVEELAEEKLWTQEALATLQREFGSGMVRQDEAFRPINDHYRMVMRSWARAVNSSKNKGANGGDLETILEDEAMNFGPFKGCAAASEDFDNSCKSPQLDSEAGESHTQLQNVHFLSPNELIAEYKATKGEKLKLRNRLHSLKSEPGNDGEHRFQMIRGQYKRAKAKLKLLEALMTKAK